MCAKLRLIRAGDPTEPVEQYQADVDSGSTDPFPYERLMIFYRKEKHYAEELKVINKGIDTLKKFYQRQQSQTLGRKIPASVKSLSDKINKTTGLHDKKGNAVYLPEPLPKWIKRKEVTEAKLKAQTAKATGKKIARKKKAAVRKRSK